MRDGAGQPVSLKLEAGLESALSQAAQALQTATGGKDAWAQLLPAVPRKGSLMEKLIKNKGTATHMQVRQPGQLEGEGLGRCGRVGQVACGERWMVSQRPRGAGCWEVGRGAITGCLGTAAARCS